MNWDQEAADDEVEREYLEREGAAYQAYLDAEADEHECDREGECGCAEDAADADRDYGDWF